LESEDLRVKVVIPVAGLGTRLRPHTYTQPKPLVQVAGKAVLAHVLDQLTSLPIEEIIFITGHLGTKIEQFVKDNYKIPSRFVVQAELRGQAHAIDLAAEFIDQPVLIIFVDTIIRTDFDELVGFRDDGVLFVHEVPDPRRFGVAVLEDGFIKQLVEKPKTPVSNLAVVGVYFLRNWKLLKRSLREVIESDRQTAGEYYLADALQVMIEHGAKLRARPVDVWEDCGTVDALLQTNRYLLANGYSQEDIEVHNSVIVSPSYIGRHARIENSIVGPFASVADHAHVTGSIVRDSIVNSGARIVDVMLGRSLVGSNSTVKGSRAKLNVGDDSQVELE
jgi:glucose-1-phosphate thymidylyltransferase